MKKTISKVKRRPSEWEKIIANETTDPDTGKDWKQEEKGTTEDEMVGWHHQFNGHESEQAPGVGDGQGSLACCSPWGRKELDMTERLNWCLLCRNVCLVFLFTFFYWDACFSGIELHELLMYFGDEFFVSCFICYYFLPFWRPSFHLAYSFLHCVKTFKFN